MATRVVWMISIVCRCECKLVQMDWMFVSETTTTVDKLFWPTATSVWRNSDDFVGYGTRWATEHCQVWDDGCWKFPMTMMITATIQNSKKNVVTKCLARTLTDVVARKKGQMIVVSPKMKEVLSEDYPKAVIAQIWSAELFKKNLDPISSRSSKWSWRWCRDQIWGPNSLILIVQRSSFPLCLKFCLLLRFEFFVTAFLTQHWISSLGTQTHKRFKEIWASMMDGMVVPRQVEVLVNELRGKLSHERCNFSG